MKKWLLEKEAAHRFEQFLRTAVRPTAEQVARFIESRSSSSSSDLGCLTIAGDVAQVSVVGVLTPQPDFWAWLFYGATTSYAEIRDALASAAANPAVKRVELLVDSPGGALAGLFETLGALEAFEKPITVRASLAASAAYALAAMAGKIEAMTVASEFGSVGVVASFYVDEAVVNVTSTDAPNKRPDVTTSEGQAVVREELDALHEELVDAIARGRTRAGRSTTTAEVNAEFGRGGMFIARTAKAAGMIDKVAGRPSTAARKVKADALLLPDATDLAGEAQAMAELGARRPGESQEAHVDRLCAMAEALTPSRPGRHVRSGWPERDLGDRMADALCLPSVEDNAERHARARAWKLQRGREIGLSPEAALQCDFGPPPARREKLTLDLSGLANMFRPAQATPRSGAPDLGDRMADAMGLAPDPLERHAQQRPAGSTAPRTKDLGDLLADALGLPPDASELGESRVQ